MEIDKNLKMNIFEKLFWILAIISFTNIFFIDILFLLFLLFEKVAWGFYDF